MAREERNTMSGRLRGFLNRAEEEMQSQRSANSTPPPPSDEIPVDNSHMDEVTTLPPKSEEERQRIAAECVKALYGPKSTDDDKDDPQRGRPPIDLGLQDAELTLNNIYPLNDSGNVKR